MSALSITQLDANIANAQLSTGPRTVAGKQRSSQNAVSHAIFAKTIPTRDQDAYLRLLEQFQKDLRPKGAVEEQLTESVADAQWRLIRCRELQASLLFAETETPGQQLDTLNKYSLYESRLNRILQSQLKQLRDIQEARARNEDTDMLKASVISKSMSAKQIEYDPAEDGFVFSAAELAVWMRRNERFEAARQERAFGNRPSRPVR